MKKRLSANQWQAARTRWQSSVEPGFGWLARWVGETYRIEVSRQAVAVKAVRAGWEKAEAAAPGNLIPAIAKHQPVAMQMPDRPQPTKGLGYRPEFDQMIVAFFNKEPFTKVPVPQVDGSVVMQQMATVLPTLSCFAKTIGALAVDQLSSWATTTDAGGNLLHPSFAEAYQKARSLQEALLVRGALAGAYVPVMVTFLLKNLHGWQDAPDPPKSSVPVVSTEELDRIFDERMAQARARQATVLKERQHLFAVG